LETTTNKGQIYIIVVTIAFLALLCVSTTCWLAYLGKDVPQALSLLTGGFSGALTTMLTKTTPTQTTTVAALPVTSGIESTFGGAPAKVQVVNKPDNPVPTEEQKI
jgi:hypothetical protein